MCYYRKYEPTGGQPNAFVVLEVFGYFLTVLLQQFFFDLDMVGCADAL